MSLIYVLPPGTRIVLDAIFNAHASVIVFFVLSGYVLTGSLLRRGLSWSGIEGFYVGRLFRLFPALWVASAISALCLLVCPELSIHPAPNGWFTLYLHPFPSGLELVLATLAIDKSLIMPVWTIFIELMGSALMPLIVTLALLKTRLLRGYSRNGMGRLPFGLSPHRLNSLAYIFDFMLGAWLASRKWTFASGRSLSKLLAPHSCSCFFDQCASHCAMASMRHFTLDTMIPCQCWWKVSQRSS